jgi:hypothetical protein
MKNPFGNYVIQKALKLATGYHKGKLTGIIKKHIEKLHDKKLIAKWKNILANLSAKNLTLGNLGAIQHIINHNDSHNNSCGSNNSSFSHSPISPNSNRSPHSQRSNNSINSFHSSNSINPMMTNNNRMKGLTTMKTIASVNGNRLFVPMVDTRASKSEVNSPINTMMNNFNSVNSGVNFNVNFNVQYPNYPSNFTDYANLQK